MKSSIIFGLLFTFLFSHAAYAVEPGNKGEGDEHSEGGVIYLNKETFKQQVFDFETNKEWNYEGKVPAILDFYADWCGPCKMLAPVLNNIQKEYSGKIQVFKVDTDKERV
jgi:thioredoxin 1